MSEKREETAMLWSFRGYRLLLLMGLLFFLTSGQAGGREPSFLLKVTLNGEGTVTSNPPGIKCTTGNRGTCQKTFREGTQVTLTANPATGWRFDSWGGDPDCTDGQVTMNASKTCTANFVQITWAKTYGGAGYDYATSIQQTTDGGYIVAGRTRSFGAGLDDFWVLKLNASGNVQWQKTYGGTDWDEASSIQQTSDGGYIVAGYTDFWGAGRRLDFWVLKLNSRGDVVWQKTYGGRSEDRAFSIQQTSDGGYIVAGYTGSFGAGGGDFWVLKLSGRGDVVWQKSYGEKREDSANSIRQTSDGGYIVAGYTGSFGAGLDDFWVLKLDASGDVVWQKTYGGESRDRARSIQQTSDGGYIVAGYTGSFGAGSYDSWVLKLDVSGDVVWQKTYGGKEWDEASSIQQTSDGGYITAGASGDFAAGTRFWVVKLDATGDVQWQKTFGPATPDGPAPIQQTSDGGYIVANWNYFAGPEGWDAWVLKLDASGNVANCLPPALFRDSVGTSASTSVTPSPSSATPATPSPIITSTNVVGQDSCVTTVTHCTGSL
jgi:uncharacterized delta-60 repeat protein